MHHSYWIISSFILHLQKFHLLAFLLYGFSMNFLTREANLFAKKSGERRERRDRIQNRRIGIEYAEIGIYCGESCGNAVHIYVIRHTGGEKCKGAAQIQHVL